jgi:two-component system, LytTR family, sensor kinase
LKHQSWLSGSGRWVLFILGWAALSLLFAPEAYLHFYFRHFYLPGQAIPWREIFQLTVANSAIALLFLPAIVWLTRRFPFEGGRWKKALVVHIPACLLFSIGHSCLYWLTCYASNQLGATLFFRFHPNLLTYWAIVGFTQAIDYFRRYTQRERDLANAQLLLLKSQLQPHFLFNTLHAVSAMMHEDIEAADRMLSLLSDLLRLTIENIGHHEVSVKQELDFLQKYLEVERIRFQERLTLRLEVDPDVLDALIPSMILQPLAENSIRHGFGSHKNTGMIVVKALRRERSLMLNFSDNGRGFPKRNWEQITDGLGLTNTRRRLQQLYPANHGFRLDSPAEGGATVMFEIPYHTAPFEGSDAAMELINR